MAQYTMLTSVVFTCCSLFAAPKAPSEYEPIWVYLENSYKSTLQGMRLYAVGMMPVVVLLIKLTMSRVTDYKTRL